MVRLFVAAALLVHLALGSGAGLKIISLNEKQLTDTDLLFKKIKDNSYYSVKALLESTSADPNAIHPKSGLMPINAATDPKTSIQVFTMVLEMTNLAKRNKYGELPFEYVLRHGTPTMFDLIHKIAEPYEKYYKKALSGKNWKLMAHLTQYGIPMDEDEAALIKHKVDFDDVRQEIRQLEEKLAIAKAKFNVYDFANQ